MPATALLIIDVQIGIMAGAHRETEVLAAITGMADRARAVGATIIYLQHCHDRYAPMMRGAEGWPIHPSVTPKPGDTVIEKSASDSFYQTTLAAKLETLGVQDLVICGLQTEFCVDATARAALSRGYRVTLASDAHSTGDAITPAETTIRHHNYALGNLAHPNGPIKIQTSDQITFVE